MKAATTYGLALLREHSSAAEPVSHPVDRLAFLEIPMVLDSASSSSAPLAQSVTRP